MLKTYTMERSAEWDKTVRSFADYDVYYLSGYVKAFQLHGDGEPLLFYYEDEAVRGINVVMKRDIAKDPHFVGKLPGNTYFDFSTPYGYGGWLLEGNGSIDALHKVYREWCVRNHVVAEFVRFSLFSNSRDRYYGTLIRRMNNIVRDLDRPMADMLFDFEHKVRKNNKHAEAAGLSVAVDETGDRLKEFLEIYYGTMNRNHASDAYYFKEEFFRTINEIKGHFVYFHVIKENKVISTELVLIGSDTMYSFLGGTDSEYFADRPNDYLKYAVIKWGLEKGCKRFVLGGGYGSDDGIFQYKKSFAPQGIVPFYTGQTVFDEKAYSELTEMRNLTETIDYFPAYRGQ